MQRITRILLVGLALTLVLLSIGAKPQPTPIQITWEGITSCGWDCNRTDGCIGFDEGWKFIAQGDLGPGESFTYISPEPLCHASTLITAGVAGVKGKHRLLVTIDVWDTEYSWSDQGIGSACLVPPPGDGQGTKYWSVTVTNAHGHKTVKDIRVYGSAWGVPLATHSCP